MVKSLCFATMCKNEEHCIKETLESIYKYIDYWIVCDTGSTDNTCNIVKDFFKEKNIPGELFIDPWIGFDHNKTLLFDRCFEKSDYILHLDADDLLIGDFKFNPNEIKDTYYVSTKRGILNYKCLILFNNKLHWKFCGVAHTSIKCIEKDYTTSDELVCKDVYLHSRDSGSRSFDPDKYLKDAEKLKKQFFDTLFEDPDNINQRSIFYAAQSYMDAKNFEEALKWYSLYLKYNDGWIEENFESNLRIMIILIRLKKDFNEITKYFNESIKIFDDRAEPYYLFGKYCNDIGKNEEAYNLLTLAKEKNYDEINKKYSLFVRKNCYDKFVYDELSVACYWTERYKEGYNLLLSIINDDIFKEHHERFKQNEDYFKAKLNID